MPDNFITHPLEQKTNHPANIKSIYKFAAECIGIPYEELTVIVGKNFLKLFGNQLL
jgi:Tat protein secretion system quality control protein TatD with DNase activity